MLAVIGWGVLAVLLLSLALAVALVMLPIRVVALARSAPDRALMVRVAPLAGAVPAIAVVDSKRPAKPKDKEKREQKKAKREARKKRAGVGPSARDWLRGVPTLLGELLLAIRFGHLRAEIDFGFDDPSDTGAVFGLLTPFLYGCPPVTGIALIARPDFGRARLEGHVEAALDVTPAKLIAPFVRYGWSVFQGTRV